MTDSRRFDVEVQLLRETFERERRRAEQLSDSARMDDVRVITSIGVDLLELRRQFDALVQRVDVVEKRIGEIAAAAAAITRMLGDDAVLRASRQRLFNWFIATILGGGAVLIALAMILVWRLW